MVRIDEIGEQSGCAQSKETSASHTLHFLSLTDVSGFEEHMCHYHMGLFTLKRFEKCFLITESNRDIIKNMLNYI